MKKIEFLITLIRKMSQNETVSIDNDIADEEFIQHLNDAQDRLQSLISNTRETSKVFVTEKIINCVANQDGYSIPDRLFFNKSIENLEFSYDRTLSNYYPIKKLSLFNRNTNNSDAPQGYYRRQGKFYPVPILSSSAGSFRVMYERSLDDLDKRRAQITAVSGLSSTTFVDMTLTGASGTGDPDKTSSPTNFTDIDYVCVCNKDGGVTSYNIPVGSFNSSTNVLTPSTGYLFSDGETIAVGNYVTFHKYTTTHSTLADECEKYLVRYTVLGILNRDSSVDFAESDEMLQSFQKEIVEQYKKQSGEVQMIPQRDEYEWY